MSTAQKTITVLGTGNMGAPVVRRLCGAGYSVRVWNRTLAKAQALADCGAKVLDTASAAVLETDWVIGFLENGAVAEQVLQEHGVLATMQPGAMYIEMASILPAQAQLHAQWFHARGLRYIDAPVSGGTIGAQSGTLSIMVGGPAQDYQEACEDKQAPLSHLGRCTHVGPVGCGQLAKLVNQMLVGITLGAVAEGLVLAKAGGADPAKVRQAIMGGFADSRVLEVHGQRMLDEDFTPRARLAIQLKDMRNCMTMAQSLDQPLPITGLLTQLYELACQRGLGELDQAAFIQAFQST